MSQEQNKIEQHSVQHQVIKKPMLLFPRENNEILFLVVIFWTMLSFCTLNGATAAKSNKQDLPRQYTKLNRHPKKKK